MTPRFPRLANVLVQWGPLQPCLSPSPALLRFLGLHCNIISLSHFRMNFLPTCEDRRAAPGPLLWLSPNSLADRAPSNDPAKPKALDQAQRIRSPSVVWKYSTALRNSFQIKVLNFTWYFLCSQGNGLAFCYLLFGKSRLILVQGPVPSPSESCQPWEASGWWSTWAPGKLKTNYSYTMHFIFLFF